MNTHHVPSLELCQELDRLCREKGILLPDTEYTWARHQGMDGSWSKWYLHLENDNHYPDEDIPAPLVSEQGKWLPYSISGKNRDGYYLVCDKAKEDWHVGYDDIQGNTYTQQTADTEANARQKMLNYLIAEGLITKL